MDLKKQLSVLSLTTIHNDTIIAELSVIPACLESFFEEGCWTSQHDREVALCDINSVAMYKN
ncbi:MAG TPA: hypothetical protein VJ000_04175 [Thermodesulfovibrionia bacterium]|nr:hypothetical protein [Thermodesulfovibrionia bacterium]